MDLQSLFNLIDGLNIDSIVSEDVLLKASLIHHISKLSNEGRSSSKKSGEISPNEFYSYYQVERQLNLNKEKRYSSCDRRDIYKYNSVSPNFSSKNVNTDENSFPHFNCPEIAIEGGNSSVEGDK